ncbi:hypothetical protein [Singulisphaera sp. GP187]|uniref:hypothetical protein n=1 Tax=Singulisphaera sp. GP187 TaxID=1882752 RepID=UPI0011612125|nr:hypothetical protein [Singulisphaera sp. GP187]
MGAPMLAEAQQGGLFPLAPIKRQRVPCNQENPVYGLYRHEYFGYHPTCWRKFPAGWGCPSPEAPDAAASFQKRPRDPAMPLTPDDFGGPGRDREPMGGEEPEGPAGPDDTNLPPLPQGGVRRPFQIDRDKPDSGPAPRQAPPAGPNTNPLDLLAPPATGPAERSSNPPMPDLPPVTESADPAAGSGPVESPLLALPDPADSAPANRVQGSLTAPNPAIGPGASNFSQPAPRQAPRRVSLLGGLFGGMAKTRR